MNRMKLKVLLNQMLNDTKGLKKTNKVMCFKTVLSVSRIHVCAFLTQGNCDPEEFMLHFTWPAEVKLV